MTHCKKVSGIKRHIAVDTVAPCDTRGTTADVTDRAGALAMFDRRRDASVKCRTCWWTGVTPESPLPLRCKACWEPAVEVVKRNELHTFVVLPKRWVVERSFAWLEKCRRLWKNCESQYQPANGGACLHGANPEKIVDRLLGRR